MNDYGEMTTVEYKPDDHVEVYVPFASNYSSLFSSNESVEDRIDYVSSQSTKNNDKIQVSVMDVAAYVLEKIGKCTSMKLHKLLYYCQAWSLVWDEAPLFNDRIEAWANGPVIRRLFNYHRGLYEVSADDFSIGNSQLLSSVQKETVDKVLEFYGTKSAQWLINLTHSEAPWINARKGLSPSERGCNEIKQSDMADYYSAL